MSVTRWTFKDTTTDEVVVLPLNPNKMDAPTTDRVIAWGWGSKWGLDRMRGIEVVPGAPSTWTFSGVIQTKAHYDLLLAWTKRLVVVRVTDHLGRSFKVIIQKFDPIERRATANGSPWRADYTMSCLLLEVL